MHTSNDTGHAPNTNTIADVNTHAIPNDTFQNRSKLCYWENLKLQLGHAFKRFNFAYLDVSGQAKQVNEAISEFQKTDEEFEKENKSPKRGTAVKHKAPQNFGDI